MERDVMSLHASLEDLTAEVVLSMTDGEAETVFSAIRWAESNGTPVCTKCGSQKSWQYSGRALYRCQHCGHQFSVTSGTPFNARKMPLKQYLLAMAVVAAGGSANHLAKVAGVQGKTAWRLVKQITESGLVSVAPKNAPKKRGRKRIIRFLDCTNCGVRFVDEKGEKTSALKRGKIKNAFCCHPCAMAYPAKLRSEERCKRCEKSRAELASWQTDLGTTGVTFHYGHCQKCWGLLRAYAGDEGLCGLHELTQQLRKEKTNDFERKEHRRPAQSPAGGYRGRPQGQS